MWSGERAMIRASWSQNGRSITLRSSSGPSISLRRNGKAWYGVTKPRGRGYSIQITVEKASSVEAP